VVGLIANGKSGFATFLHVARLLSKCDCRREFADVAIASRSQAYMSETCTFCQIDISSSPPDLTMKPITADSPTLSPHSLSNQSVLISEQPKECQCGSIRHLGKFPFLLAVEDRAEEGFIPYLFTVMTHAMVYVFSLMHGNIFQGFLIYLGWTDRMGLYTVCYLEYALPQVNRFVWGDVSRDPRSYCEKSLVRHERLRKSVAGEKFEILL